MHLPFSGTPCQFPLPASGCRFDIPSPISSQSMSIRRLSILTIGIVLYPGLARAQSQSPIAAGAAPSVSVSFGYSSVSLGMTPSSRVALNGLDASAATDFVSRIGVKLDVGYARASDVFASGRHSDVLNYLGGPVVRLSRRRRFAAYAQGLLGGRQGYGARPAHGRRIR